MTRTRMLDGTYCYTGPQCRQHAAAIRETALTQKAIKSLAKEEKLFLAQRQFDTERNPNTFENTLSNDPDAWWKCPVADDHRWQAPKNKRLSRGDGCPFCSGHRASSTNNLADHAPDVALELIWAPNGKTARDLTVKSNETCGWHCRNCGHEWEATPNTRSTSGCNNCRERSGGFILTFENSVAGRYPHLVDEFDVEANGMTADMMSAGTIKNCGWRCRTCGHKWPASPHNRGRRGDRCPACVGKVPRKGESLLDLMPEIAAELDEEASGFRAIDTVLGSGKTAQWRCQNNPMHRWPAAVRSRTGFNTHKTKFGCPECTKAHTSQVEQYFATHFSPYLEEMLKFSDKLSIPWRKNKRMSVDIAGAYRGRKVAIEYDGYFYHYKEDDVGRDFDKSAALLRAGYLVVRIREGLLPDLNMQHPNLYQLDFAFSHEAAKTQAAVDKILMWLDTQIQP